MISPCDLDIDGDSLLGHVFLAGEMFLTQHFIDLPQAYFVICNKPASFWRSRLGASQHYLQFLVEDSCRDVDFL